MTAEKTKEEIMAEAFEQIAIDHVSFFDSRPEDEREEYFSIIRDAYDLGQQQNAALIEENENLKSAVLKLTETIRYMDGEDDNDEYYLPGGHPGV